jgi:hypothetical protein
VVAATGAVWAEEAKEATMTVSTNRAKTASGLREVAAALQGAESAVGGQDDRVAHDALLALARSIYESLSQFERESAPAALELPTALQILARVRQELDETRIQLALAEMEAREAGEELLRKVEPMVAPAADRVLGAIEEILGALADVRRGLSDRNA